jgi:FtsZ-interacting cell division protein ZipA
MKQSIWWLFAIPIVAIIIVVVNQFWDEMFKKKFVIDRRNPSSRGTSADRRRSGKSESRDRRYNDPVAPSIQSETTPESSKDQAQPGFEPSGISN